MILLGLHQIVWVYVSSNAIRIEVQTTEMKVDRRLDAFLVAVTLAANLDHLDLAVDTLGVAIVGIQNNGVEDAPEMLLDHPGHLLDGLQTAADRPAIPALPSLFRPSPTDSAVNAF